MTKRLACEFCIRPLKTCICKYVRQVNNRVSLIILQHPLEVFEAKNSARLLSLCLKNSQLHVGEDFDQRFFDGIKCPDYYDLLLYPDTPEEKSLGIAHPPEIDQKLINYLQANLR